MPRCSWFEPDQTYACIDPDVDYGQVVLNGCDVNCYPCDTDTESFLYSIGLNTIGPARWIRPSTAKESRNAYGIAEPVIARVPIRTPRVSTYFEISPCHKQRDNSGALDITEEIFLLHLCSCPWRPFQHSDGTWNPCPEIDPGVDPVYRPGLIPTCWWFNQNDWPPRPMISMACTSYRYGHGPMLVIFPQGLIREFANLRVLAGGNVGGCATNVGVFCWGHREENRCHAENEWGTEYYNDSHVGIWDFAYTNATGACFVAPTGLSEEHQAIVDAKNAALSYLATRQLPADGDVVKNFEQLDSPRRHASPGQNLNSNLTLWDRSWNMYGGAVTIPYSRLPTVCEFPGSYLLASGHSVIVEYVIVSAEWTMSLVAHRRKEKPIGDFPTSRMINPTYPMVRHQIEINMGLRVRFPDDAPRYLQRTWLETPDQIELTIPAMDSPLPRIEPSGLDKIIYVDAQSRRLPPPLRVVWEGERGFFSDPATEDVFDHDYWDENPQTNQYHCNALARGFGGIGGSLTDWFSVPAVESHPEHAAGDRKRIWGGEVTISFPHGT